MKGADPNLIAPPRDGAKPERIYLSPPCMMGRERDLLLDAFDSNWIAPLGPHVEAFQREFADRIGWGHAVAVASGTAALHLALRLLGVRSGDEVVVSSFTFIASVAPIIYQGALPVLIDSDEATWNMDADLLEEELKACAARGRLPKAVIAVDIYGQCADYRRIGPICAEYGVPLVEDATESLGATLDGRAAGSFGTIGCFSFNGNKMITTGGGGMILASSEAFAREAQHLATQAREPAPHFEHVTTGYNYRLSNLAAALGRGQLESLDRFVEACRANCAHYAELLGDLPGVSLMPEPPGHRASRWLTVILIDPSRFGADWAQVRDALEAQNVEARPVFKPMHLQPALRGYRRRGGHVAESLFARGLCLPSGVDLRPEDRQRIAGIIRSCARRRAVA